ncbi:MAG: hypothetical protein J7L23_01805 [Candidatus Diapherotrites archaeon]|nr:hypothetical protein [Candidatus Diapherotrites archaeon]
MKSFWTLVREPKFGLFLAMAFLISGYDLAYGSKLIGAIFLALIFGSIAINLWMTRGKR